VPALFFVCTRNTQSGEPFWFDWIISPIQALRLGSLDLREFGLGVYYFPESEDFNRWNSIQKLLVDIKTIGNPSDPRVERIIAFFKDSFVDLKTEVVSKYRPLNANEISEMHGSTLCYFGSHSHRHEILTYLTNEDLMFNLVASKAFLEGLLSRHVSHFAYPNGDTNAAVTAYSKEVGYTHGYLSTSGILKKDTDPMTIPRIAVSGYDSIHSLYFKINSQLLRAATRF
jgi:hypothetical protein